MSSETKSDVEIITDRISELETRIDSRIDDRILDLEERLHKQFEKKLDAKLDSMLEQLLAVVSVNQEQTSRLKKDMQTGMMHLDENLQEVSDSFQETKSELWRNITEQNVRVDEVVIVTDAIQATQERQYNRVEQVEPRLVNLEYEERLIQCMMDTSFTLLCTDIEPEVDDEEVNLTDREADVLMDELVLELQHISEEFNAMVTKDTVPVANLKVYPGAVNIRAREMHTMKATYFSRCRVLVLSMSLPCVVLPGVGLQGGVTLLREDVGPEARRVFDPGGLAEWL